MPLLFWIMLAVVIVAINVAVSALVGRRMWRRAAAAVDKCCSEATFRAVVMFGSRTLQCPAGVALTAEDLRVYPAIGNPLIIPLAGLTLLEHHYRPFNFQGKWFWWGRRIVKFQDNRTGGRYVLGFSKKQIIPDALKR